MRILTLSIRGSPTVNPEVADTVPSSRVWCRHFRRNARRLLGIPWEEGVGLSAAEHALVAASLAEFQQGEGLEGGHFFRCVRVYAERTGDWDYVEAHRLFMAEEKRHAQDLGRFLTLAGVPLLPQDSRRNRFFCWCGRRGGLEMTLAIIVMVEIMAQVYYRCLQRATRSVVLRRLCTQILRDEAAHVRFQCEQLARLRRGRSRWLLALTHAADFLLFVGAMLVCWSGHRHVLRAGARDVRGVCHEAGRKLARAWRLKKPCRG